MHYKEKISKMNRPANHQLKLLKKECLQRIASKTHFLPILTRFAALVTEQRVNHFQMAYLHREPVNDSHNLRAA